MAKDVMVKFTGANTPNGMIVTRDMTLGRTYLAQMPSAGEIDPEGLPVIYDDELWVKEDDVGESVITQLSDGFELV